MRITAIIPAYNCADYLEDAVTSVLAQSCPVHELIVVDDGSTDATPEVARKFAGRVAYVRTANGGAAAARNAGLGRATGDLVAFLDADDAWYPNKLEVQLQALSRRPQVKAVCSDFSLVDQHGTVVRARHVKGKYRVFHAYGLDWPQIFPLSEALGRSHFYHGDAFPALFLGNFVNTSSILARRDAVTAAGGFTGGRRTQEDYELWLKLAAGGAFGYVDDPLLMFRRRPNQLTSDDQGLQVIEDTVEVAAQFVEIARGRSGAATAARRLSDLYCTLAVARLGASDATGARRALARARAHGGASFQTAGLYAWSWIPQRFAGRVRRGFRRLRPREVPAIR